MAAADSQWRQGDHREQLAAGRITMRRHSAASPGRRLRIAARTPLSRHGQRPG